MCRQRSCDLTSVTHHYGHAEGHAARHGCHIRRFLLNVHAFLRPDVCVLVHWSLLRQRLLLIRFLLDHLLLLTNCTDTHRFDKEYTSETRCQCSRQRALHKVQAAGVFLSGNKTESRARAQDNADRVLTYAGPSALQLARAAPSLAASCPAEGGALLAAVRPPLCEASAPCAAKPDAASWRLVSSLVSQAALARIAAVPAVAAAQERRSDFAGGGTSDYRLPCRWGDPAFALYARKTSSDWSAAACSCRLLLW